MAEEVVASNFGSIVTIVSLCLVGIGGAIAVAGKMLWNALMKQIDLRTEAMSAEIASLKLMSCKHGGGEKRPCDSLVIGFEMQEVMNDNEKSHYPEPHHRRKTMKHALGIVILLLLCSCTGERKERQVSHQFGVKDGLPTDMTTTTETREATSGGVDVGALISAAVQASQGKLLGALEAIKPPTIPNIPSISEITQAVSSVQKPTGGTDWNTITAAGIAALMAGIAAHQAKAAKGQQKEKEVIAADRDKAYDGWLEANRQLPPKV
jgi:hypothetical protein